MRLTVKATLAFGLLIAAATVSAADSLVKIPATQRTYPDPATLVDITVRVSPFSLGKAEVTQAQFQAVMGYNPALHRGDNLPVDNVSWWEALRYCNLLSRKEGLAPCYDLSSGACDFAAAGYRLPTDAEWSAADSQAAPADSAALVRAANLGGSDNESIPRLLADLKSHSTRPSGSYPPNFYGLYDMRGNLWEWVNDNHDPLAEEALPPDNPAGRVWSPERTLRGGSYISLVSSWGRGYRTCLDPERKSRFVGFRVCRSDRAAEVSVSRTQDDVFFAPYDRVPEGFRDTGGLSDLLRDEKSRPITDTATWEKHRAVLRAKWERILGVMPDSFPGPNVKLVKEYDEDLYHGSLMYLQVERDYWEKILVLRPRRPVRTPTPVVIVPYYDVDTPAGRNLGGRSYMPPSVRSFALQAVEEGFIAVAVRWFGESYSAGYAEAVAELKLRHPGLSGLGKWVWDSQRLLDYVCTLPDADPQHIGIIGHSLGGKMSLYAASFDSRITAAVGSDLGIGLEYSNYEDYWYFDETIKSRDKATDHHELLGLIAPRPFLLIAGEYDKDSSWHFINAARRVYGLYGDPRRAAEFNHATGHTPTPEAVRLSLDWLERFLIY